jgi:hypothetical protein
MPHKEIIALLALSNIVLFGSTVTFVALWIRARERAIRAAVDSERQVEPASDIERLVNAVDAIAVEVERISEAQRFTTKVLVERNDAGTVAKRLSSPERVITPH